MPVQVPEGIIPTLTGRDNYKEWSKKVEMYLRVKNLWLTVLSPPRPITSTELDNIFVASRKRIFVQCPTYVDMNVKFFLLRVMAAGTVQPDFALATVSRIWRDLRRKYGDVKEKTNQLKTNMKAKNKRKPKPASGAVEQEAQT